MPEKDINARLNDGNKDLLRNRIFLLTLIYTAYNSPVGGSYLNFILSTDLILQKICVYWCTEYKFIPNLC